MALHKKKHQSMTQKELEARSHARYASGSRHALGKRSIASTESQAGANRAHANNTKDPSSHELGRQNAVSYYALKRKRALKRRILRTLGFSLLGLFCTAGVAFALAFAYLNSINHQINSKVTKDLLSVLSDTKDNEPFYALLLGIDKDEDRAESKEYGPSDGAYRSDTIMLTRIDPKNRKITLISIPRDTYVDMGKHGKQKINAAYSVGGAAYATQVISKFAGVKIAHYAEVDMDGFAKVVDTIGGVDVDLPVPVRDPDYTEINLPAGKQHIDGYTAAQLGRARHAYDKYGDGDTYRAANQRMLIGCILKSVLSSGPAGITNSISTMAQYVTTDMNVTEIIGLATKFAGMDVSTDIYSGQCPTTSKYINRTWFEICDTKKWQAMVARIEEGLPPYEGEAQNTGSGIAGAVGVSSSDSRDKGADPSNSEDSATYEGTVAVLNATGKAGIAQKRADELANKGFSANPGNARRVVKSTVIYYSKGSEDKAKGVAKVLGVAGKLQENTGQYDSGTDVVVLLGKDQL